MAVSAFGAHKQIRCDTKFSVFQTVSQQVQHDLNQSRLMAKDDAEIGLQFDCGVLFLNLSREQTDGFIGHFGNFDRRDAKFSGADAAVFEQIVH